MKATFQRCLQPMEQGGAGHGGGGGGADGDALDCLLSDYFDCDHEANFLDVGNG